MVVLASGCALYSKVNCKTCTHLIKCLQMFNVNLPDIMLWCKTSRKQTLYWHMQKSPSPSLSVLHTHNAGVWFCSNNSQGEKNHWWGGEKGKKSAFLSSAPNSKWSGLFEMLPKGTINLLLVPIPHEHVCQIPIRSLPTKNHTDRQRLHTQTQTGKYIWCLIQNAVNTANGSDTARNWRKTGKKTGRKQQFCLYSLCFIYKRAST